MTLFGAHLLGKHGCKWSFRSLLPLFTDEHTVVTVYFIYFFACFCCFYTEWWKEYPCCKSVFIGFVGRINIFFFLTQKILFQKIPGYLEDKCLPTCISQFQVGSACSKLSEVVTYTPPRQRT